MIQRVGTAQISSGMRGIIRRFEVSIRHHEMKGAQDPVDWDRIDAYFDKCRQELLRKIIRLEKKDGI